MLNGCSWPAGRNPQGSGPAEAAHGPIVRCNVHMWNTAPLPHAEIVITLITAVIPRVASLEPMMMVPEKLVRQMKAWAWTAGEVVWDGMGWRMRWE
jgi:hypothetical protein